MPGLVDTQALNKPLGAMDQCLPGVRRLSAEHRRLEGSLGDVADRLLNVVHAGGAKPIRDRFFYDLKRVK